MDSVIINNIVGFEWDGNNVPKNQKKHGVMPAECEEVFFNRPLLVMDDEKHSNHETRHFVLGKTDDGRKLMVVFTVRKNLIRVISARDMSRRERKVYEEQEEA